LTTRIECSRNPSRGSRPTSGIQLRPESSPASAPAPLRTVRLFPSHPLPDAWERVFPGRVRRRDEGSSLFIRSRFGGVIRRTRLLSLGRTLPASVLRTDAFGILSRCQLPRPNCQRTKRAVGTSACGATHWRLVSLSWTEVRLDASSRASTHDAHRRNPPHQQRDPRRQGPHEQERGNRTPTTQGSPGIQRDRPQPNEKLAEGSGIVKRPEKLA